MKTRTPLFMKSQKKLEEIFHAEKSLREKETQFFRESPDDIKQALTLSVDELLESGSEDAVMYLERLADLCAQIEDNSAFILLIKILNHSEPSVRVQAGEALVDLAYEKYAPFARTVEEWLEQKKEGPALQELPWLIAEIGEPSALPLIRRFLSNDSAEVVSSAIEALVSLGEKSAVEDLKRLTQDKRIVSLDDTEEETAVSIGELASEAIEELEPLS